MSKNATAVTGRYIALVIVTCYVDGVRTDLQPGDPLPEDMSEHDITQLKRLGAIEDTQETAAAAKAEAREERKAGSEFQEARAAVKAAVASTSAGAPAGDKKGA